MQKPSALEHGLGFGSVRNRSIRRKFIAVRILRSHVLRVRPSAGEGERSTVAGRELINLPKALSCSRNPFLKKQSISKSGGRMRAGRSGGGGAGCPGLREKPATRG